MSRPRAVMQTDREDLVLRFASSYHCKLPPATMGTSWPFRLFLGIRASAAAAN
jgi:hypothetical protein